MLRKIAALSLVIMLLPFSALAEALFTQDVAAINEAVKSVLLLEVYDSDDELIATGSGFVAFNNRTLVTNHHVIKDADMIMAYSDDGYSYIVDRVFVADEKADVALLGFFSPTDLSPLPLGTESQTLRAEPIVVIGSPKGLINTVSMGNVSAIFSDNGISYIQFTAPISSGSSGGPLFNDQGEVIGITSASYDDGEGIVQNLNFAVGIDEAERLFAEVDEKNAVSLEEYDEGMRPGARPTPVPTPTPTTKPTETPTLKPIPTVKPTENHTTKPATTPKVGSRISDVSVEDKGEGRYLVTWSDRLKGEFTYGIAYQKEGSETPRALRVTPEPLLYGKLGVTIVVPLETGFRYEFSVDSTTKTAKEALSLGATAENVFQFTPTSFISLKELQQGDRGADVKNMQQALIALGYLDGEADGIFGKQTMQAVYEFKVANGLMTYESTYVATEEMQTKLYGSDAKAIRDPAFSLQLADKSGRSQNLSGDMLNMSIQVTNTATKKTVKAFELYMYATDVWGNNLYGDKVYYATTIKEVAPGKTVYSDYIALPNRSKISHVYVGISKIVYSDGSVAEATSVKYSRWSIN